jgi:hypothetical protein
MFCFCTKRQKSLGRDLREEMIDCRQQCPLSFLGRAYCSPAVFGPYQGTIGDIERKRNYAPEVKLKRKRARAMMSTNVARNLKKWPTYSFEGLRSDLVDGI